jgi:hypothetical protein
MPHLPDDGSNHGLAHVSMAPHPVQKFFVRHELVGPAHELAQHREGPRRQLDAGAVTGKAALLFIDLEGAETRVQGGKVVHVAGDSSRASSQRGTFQTER